VENETGSDLAVGLVLNRTLSTLNALPLTEDSRHAETGDGGGRGCPACGAVRPTAAGFIRRDAVSRTAPGQAIAAALRHVPDLTPRERATFELLGLGYDNRLIARTFAISERTVKRHITAILGKLNLESRLQAGLAALIMSSRAPAEDNQGGVAQKSHGPNVDMQEC
jgi:DNA-binding CsgD family transcriptional regulator